MSENNNNNDNQGNRSQNGGSGSDNSGGHRQNSDTCGRGRSCGRGSSGGRGRGSQGRSNNGNGNRSGNDDDNRSCGFEGETEKIEKHARGANEKHPQTECVPSTKNTAECFGENLKHGDEMQVGMETMQPTTVKPHGVESFADDDLVRKMEEESKTKSWAQSTRESEEATAKAKGKTICVKWKVQVKV